LFPAKLPDREKCIGPSGILGLIPTLREPSLASVQILDPKGPGPSPAEDHDVESLVHDRVFWSSIRPRQRLGRASVRKLHEYDSTPF
jgi:hypothetical protein